MQLLRRTGFLLPGHTFYFLMPHQKSQNILKISRFSCGVTYIIELEYCEQEVLDIFSTIIVI